MENLAGWLGRAPRGRVTGRAAADSCVNGPIVARMRANPDIGELDVRVFDVRQNSEHERDHAGAAAVLAAGRRTGESR
jgi:hypothetical protein